MARLKIFESVTANGFFSDAAGGVDWAYAHSGDPEFQRFVADNASGDATLLFGRITYEMMASYWPTPEAEQQQPAVAKKMNAAQKIVLSRSMKKAAWANTSIISGDVREVIGALKQSARQDIVVLGSGDVCAQLLGAGLVDDLEVVVKPVVLGDGRTLFGGATRNVELELLSQRAFKDGNLVLRYAPRR